MPRAPEPASLSIRPGPSGTTTSTALPPPLGAAVVA